MIHMNMMNQYDFSLEVTGRFLSIWGKCASTLTLPKEITSRKKLNPKIIVNYFLQGEVEFPF